MLWGRLDWPLESSSATDPRNCGCHALIWIVGDEIENPCGGRSGIVIVPLTARVPVSLYDASEWRTLASAPWLKILGLPLYYNTGFCAGPGKVAVLAVVRPFGN